VIFLSLVRLAGPENSGLLLFVACPAPDGLRQKVRWKPLEMRSQQHRLNSVSRSKPIPLFSGLIILPLHPGVETPGNKQFPHKELEHMRSF